MGIFGVNKINRLYVRTINRGGEFTSSLLEEMGITYTVCDKDLANVPATGGVVFVSNHPTGLLDGIMLIDLLSKVRPDVKFMGNFLLNRIEPLKRYFIDIDPFDNADRNMNMRGLKESMRHVADGGALVIFPAGEVATWQKGLHRLTDKAWSRSIMRFIRGLNVPVVPVCIEAHNSRTFHLAGKIHPRLRTAMLPHELLNKEGDTININIASALLPKRAAELPDIGVYGDFLRANVEYMHKKLPRRKIRIIPKRKPKPKVIEDIAAPVEYALMQAELDDIRGEHLLFTHGDYEVFCAHPCLIPRIMFEIGRLREVTFRAVGEGTMREIDTDYYDTYYHQLFIWDKANHAIVGAYRLGMGDEIVERFGLDGFYVNSLFRMSKEMEPVMSKTIELGRSFIVKEYQRKPASLMLLWKGILYVLLKHEQYRNLLGPVTISGEFDKYSKTIMLQYLLQHHYNRKLGSYIKPITGIVGIDAPINAGLIRNVASIDLINKIVMDIERDEMSMPILIKKYLQLNSHVLAFNVDHDFNDGLDALMLLDLKKVPDNTIAMLSKEITDIDVIARFRPYHNE